jgi:hypothetical protein
MTDIENINKAVELFFNENPTSEIAKPKDLMPICVKIGMFRNDNKAGLPLRNLLRKLDKISKLDLIPSLRPVRKAKNTYWFFYREQLNQNI